MKLINKMDEDIQLSMKLYQKGGKIANDKADAEKFMKSVIAKGVEILTMLLLMVV